MKEIAEDNEEDDKDTPLLLQRILLPLSCLTGFIKTIVGELQERENRCMQKANFRSVHLFYSIYLIIYLFLC